MHLIHVLNSRQSFSLKGLISVDPPMGCNLRAQLETAVTTEASKPTEDLQARGKQFLFLAKWSHDIACQNQEARPWWPASLANCKPHAALVGCKWATTLRDVTSVIQNVRTLRLWWALYLDVLSFLSFPVSVGKSWGGDSNPPMWKVGEALWWCTTCWVKSGTSTAWFWQAAGLQLCLNMGWQRLCWPCRCTKLNSLSTDSTATCSLLQSASQPFQIDKQTLTSGLIHKTLPYRPLSLSYDLIPGSFISLESMERKYKTILEKAWRPCQDWTIWWTWISRDSERCRSPGQTSSCVSHLLCLS